MIVLRNISSSDSINGTMCAYPRTFTTQILWFGYFRWFGCSKVINRPPCSMQERISSNETPRSCISSMFFLAFQRIGFFCIKAALYHRVPYVLKTYNVLFCGGPTHDWLWHGTGGPSAATEGYAAVRTARRTEVGSSMDAKYSLG